MKNGISEFVIMVVIGSWFQDPSTILKIHLRIWFLLMKIEPKSICFVEILKLATEELEIRLVSE